MNECTICFQEYGNGCLPATLPCGHLNCFDCLTLLASNEDSNAVCPCCRQPYSERNITKLFLTFPTSPAVPTPTEEAAEPPQQSDIPEPPSLTDDQKKEANELSARMSALGICTDVDELGHVLSDVKLWAAGVGAIGDMETQIAMTRLLLGVDMLRRKAEKSALTTAGVRRAENALAASRRAEVSLRDKLNRENSNTARLRTAAVEQLAHLHRWKDIATTSKGRIDELEASEIERLSRIASLGKKVKDQALEITSLSKEIDESDKRASEIEDKYRAMCADKKRYDKRVASLEKQLDAQEQVILQLGRDLRDEKERAEEYKEQTETEISNLVKDLRGADAARSDCQRELSRVTAVMEENARQILRLKQDREHWREEYFKLKEDGSTSISGSQFTAAADGLADSGSSHRARVSNAPGSPEPYTTISQNSLIDLSDGPDPDRSLSLPSHTGPIRTQRNALSRSFPIIISPATSIRSSKRTRTDAEFDPPPHCFPHRKRRAGAGDDDGTTDGGDLICMVGPGDNEDVCPRRKVRRKVALGYDGRRKTSSEYRGLTPLHELLAAAEDD